MAACTSAIRSLALAGAAGLWSCTAAPAPAEPSLPKAEVTSGHELAQGADVEAFLGRARETARDTTGRATERLVKRWPDLAVLVLRRAPEPPEVPALSTAFHRAFGGDAAGRAEYELLRARVFPGPASTAAEESRAALAAWLAREDRPRCRYLELEAAVLLLETDRGVAASPDGARAFDAAWAGALARAPGIDDLVLWERLLALRPLVASPWPADGALEDESACWARIAEQRLWRHEPDLALLAGARAETTALTNAGRARAELCKARAYHQSERRGEALVAVSRAKEASSGGSPAVLALEGVLAAECDDLASARQLLETALAQESWSGAAHAASDLAVVLALLGDDDAARAAFDRAEGLGVREQDWDGLAMTWRNRGAWLVSQGLEQEAGEWQQRAQGLVRDQGLLAPP